MQDQPIEQKISKIPKNEEQQEAEKYVAEVKDQFKGRIPTKKVEKFKESKLIVAKGEFLRKKGISIAMQYRLDLFIKEFLANGGRVGDAYSKVSPNANRHSAVTIGSQYLKMVKNLGKLYLENKGYGYGKLLDVATEKMEASKDPDWWDRVVKAAGYENEFIPGKGGKSETNIVNVIGMQKNLSEEFGFSEGELVEEEDEPTT